MSVYVYSLVAVLITSLVSLVGIFVLPRTEELFRKILLLLISVSVGALFGDALFHLIPEAFETLGEGVHVPLLIFSGILFFFVIEKFLHWQHSHLSEIEEYTTPGSVHPVGPLILIADALHNFVDGIIIAASFSVGVPVGIATTLAIVAHEIPQEMSDFAVLVHAGYSRRRALFFNFISALTSVTGAIFVLVLPLNLEHLILWSLPFAAGGFLYIAGSDLVPELHKQTSIKQSLTQLCGIVVGGGIMIALLFLE